MARSDMSKKIYRHLQHSENIHVSFVSRDMKPATNSYVENIAKASDGKIFADFDVEEIKNYIWSYSDVAANNYKIITANNYETIMLDSVLRKNSGTDTDKDKLSDWQEINTELIERLKPGAADKGYLTMYDMPTINDIIGYHEQAYVQSGLDRLTRDSLQYGSNPVEGVYRQAVTPIRSCPVDADSDNDGVIDRFDSMPLDSNDRSLNEVGEAEGKESVFTVLEEFRTKKTLIVKNKSLIYSYPNGLSLDLDIKSNGKISVHSICYSEGRYWLKIYIKDETVRWGYLEYVYTSNDDYIDNIVHEYDTFQNVAPYVDTSNTDFNSVWFKKPFNSVDKYECAWYVLGKFGEIYGVRLEFNSRTYQGKSYKGDGGWWVKNVNSKAFYWDNKNEKLSETNCMDVVIEKDPYNASGQSAACFLFYYPKYDGYYGHIVFIDAVEIVNGETTVYYSDTYVGKSTVQGKINKKSLEDFIALYDDRTPIDGESVFQGYVKVVNKK